MKNNVLIIGIDGSSWSLLQPWIDDGKLPTLKKLQEGGSLADLRTTVPPLSCSAWTSLVTGKNPGKHGIYEYLTQSGKLVNSTMIKSAKIWQTLSSYSKRCCVVNVPGTYPVDKVNGYMVGGFLTPPDEKIFSYPKSLMALLNKHNYKVLYKFLPDKEDISKNKSKFLDELYELMENRYSALKELMNENWDFFMLVFEETGTLQYLFWDEKEIMLEFFRKLDTYIGDLIKIYSSKNRNTYIFVVSDHGYSAAPKRSFNMRAWMNESGLLNDNRTLMQKFIPKIYRKVNKTPLSRLLFNFNKSKEVRASLQRRIDESSQIYYRYPGIFIDCKSLDEEMYEKLRNNIISKLRSTKDPANKEEIFQIVEKREDVYHGNSAKFAPDIVVIPHSNYAIMFSYESDNPLEDVNLYHPGRHFSDMHGLFLAYGGDVRKSRFKELSILDICPTVLHILGVPISKDVDGKVLKQIFKKNSSLLNKKIEFTQEGDMQLGEKGKINDSLKNIKI